MSLRFILTTTITILVLQNVIAQNTFELLSPDKALKVSVTIKEKIYYTLSHGEENILKDNSLSLSLENEILGRDPKLQDFKKGSVFTLIKPVVPLKYSSVSNNYNYLKLNFKNQFALEFRIFNDGVAYRFSTSKKSDIKIVDEEFQLAVPDDYVMHLQATGGFKTAYEEKYAATEAKNWRKPGDLATLPFLIDTRKGYKILISESDLTDYPCMFLEGNTTGLVSKFPKVPLTFGADGDRSLKINNEAGYIAGTKGTRSFPWRYFVIAKDDKQLLENCMTLKLAQKSELKDTSWIVPGQASWEWWNDASPYGPDVNFVSGYNTETYKYYIDFASKFGVKYIIMDEGWAKTTTDPFTPNPDVDVHEIIKYGKEKNVGVILWLTWLTVQNNMNLFATFEKWGVKGVKIDFMERSDQVMVNFYENVAREAAKHKLLVDFHGAFKPAGLEYKYPNVISYEGVRGMEQMEFCIPDNSLYIPFIRNAVGPMDYTPGAMISMQPEVYRASRPNAAGVGTRAYQLALFVVFESGLQMLADNPTLYYRNEDCTKFITSVPTTWDETHVIEANVGEVAIVAKRNGNKWFIGGITNSNKTSREFTIHFDFIEKGKTYTMTYFEDGINANRQAMDYRRKTIAVHHGDTISISMARNGGWAAVLE